MPQIIVDTATESPASLVLVSRLLQDYAVLKAKTEQQAATEYPDADAPIAHAGSDMRSPVPLVEVPVSPSNAEGTAIHAALEADPAKIFGANKPSNVVPFPPVAPIPPAPVTAAPMLTSGAPSDTISVPAAIAPSAPTATPEVDKAGVPWDARIHSSVKGRKQDGTWKLMRGVDKSLVTMVLHEITPKPHVAGGVIVPVGTAAPVAPPVAPPLVPTAPVPVVPVAPATGVVPAGDTAAPMNAVQQFQTFMQQVTAAQAAGTFTHTAVLEAVKAEGIPQLQLLIMSPEKIPAVKARLGLV